MLRFSSSYKLQHSPREKSQEAPYKKSFGAIDEEIDGLALIYNYEYINLY